MEIIFIDKLKILKIIERNGDLEKESKIFQCKTKNDVIHRVRKAEEEISKK